MNHARQIVLLFACLLVTRIESHAGSVAGDGQHDYAAERAARARDLSQPYGWLSLTALQWLKHGITTIGSAADNSVVLAGVPAHLVTFEVKDAKVAVIAASASLEFHGRPLLAAGSRPLIGIGEDDDSALSSGPLRLWVIDRGGRRYLRVKDPQAPTRTQFRGLHWYPADEHYRIQARWIPDAQPHVMHVINEIGQVTPVSVAGHVEFELGGARQTLLPIQADKNGLWFVFRDTTYRKTTYGGGRFLTTDLPSNGLDHPGTVFLDFNQAVNPPCAYSPFATCPLAPEEDRLPIAIPAGEKRYQE